MSKSAKNRAAKLHRASRSAVKPAPKTTQSKGPRHMPAQLKPAATEGRSAESTMRNLKTEASKSGSKQARVLALLSSPKGATLRQSCKLPVGNGTRSGAFWLAWSEAVSS